MITKTNPNLANLDIIEMPGLIKAFKEIKKTTTDTITPKLAYRLYDTHGLDEDMILTLANAMNLQFDPIAYRNELNEAKKRSKATSGGTIKMPLPLEELEEKIQPTVDHFKYDYKKLGGGEGGYVFPDLNVKIVAIVKNSKLTTEIAPNTPNCILLLDKTNFYSEAGGQQSDTGVIVFKNGEFHVQHTETVHNYILHYGIVKTDSLIRVGDVGLAKIDAERRLNAMRNHTGVHLLNGAVKKLLNRATCQKSSKVTDEWLTFDVGIFGEKLSMADCARVEEWINEIVGENVAVVSREVDSEVLYGIDDVTLIPGEVYPEDRVRLIEISSGNSTVFR